MRICGSKCVGRGKGQSPAVLAKPWLACSDACLTGVFSSPPSSVLASLFQTASLLSSSPARVCYWRCVLQETKKTKTH